ncbi:uncharacterized protein LOC34618199 [Cyclospora cayetanensis]|uniref:Uncharacterized protein LOC34618199 n=1 Tax=Cyclospora cayetanensis TaxID=88456 RepID=A0A6P6S526_9EIME|nr:uncharacterized protein LOC34618199 [Cyclospora cayetanensis]
MKFGAKFQSYTVPEWQEHYVDYQCLKALLKQQKRRLAAVDAPGYLAKFFPTRWHPNADKAPDSVGIASAKKLDGSTLRCASSQLCAGLPLQAAASAFGSGVAEEKTQHSSNGSAQRLEILKNVATTNSIPLAGSYQESPDAVKQPLLQSPQWQREGCQIGVTSPAEGQQGGSSARKLEALRVECVEAFRAAVEKEKTKVAAFFKDELGFLEDKLHAVSTELKAFSAARRRRALTKNAEGSARTRATCLEKTASTTHSKSGLSSSALAGVGEAEETALSSQRSARALYRQVAGEDSELSLDVLPLRTAEGLSVALSPFVGRVGPRGCRCAVLAWEFKCSFAVLRLRLAFALSFLWFATASAMAVMERYGVNYRFLLDLAPRGKASSISFFATAALHFVVTTATCVLYLADARLRLMGGSQMYHIYPLGLLLLQLLLLLIPSRSLTYRARRQVLAELYTVLKAGVFAVRDVKLVANIIGDVLTSLAKPLGDLHYLVCYLRRAALAILHRLIPDAYALFRCAEAGCGCIHLMNMAKYACGILVLITTNAPWLDWGVSVYAMCLLWVFSYCLGSLFMLYWDVRVDWGLLPTPDRFIRMQGRLMYPAWMYGAIAVTNAMGRLTWAMTLMPISFVGNKSLSGNLVLLFISVVEILRRGAWVVLRLENEHVNNSSRFRAILWVPPLHQTRLEMLEGDPLIQANSPSSFAQTKGASARGGQQHELSGFSSNV